jgi:hypothetical protein
MTVRLEQPPPLDGTNPDDVPTREDRPSVRLVGVSDGSGQITLRPDSIERAALRHRRGDDSTFYLGQGLPLLRLTAAHATFVGAGAVGPGERQHAAVVLDQEEREILTLPVQPRRCEGHEHADDAREDAAFLLPGDEREQIVWGSPPRHVVELWRGVCPEAPDWLSELWAGEWALAQYKDSVSLSTPYEGALVGVLWFGWNPLTPPEWEIAAAPLLTLAQPLAPTGLVLENLDGRSIEQRRVKAQTDADDPSVFWASRAYDVEWFKGQRPRPGDRRFLPPGEEPDEDKRAISGPYFYEPSDELPGGWVPTFQSVVIVEVSTIALWRIAWVSSQWPELLGLGVRLTTAEALPSIVKAIVGGGYRHETLIASWRFGIVDDATEPMDLGQLIGDASCDRCSSWFWYEMPSGAFRWLTAEELSQRQEGEAAGDWNGPPLKIAQHACYCCGDEAADGEDMHDEEEEYDECPVCQQEADPHLIKGSDRLSQPRLTALIWEGTGEPPAWLMIQVKHSSVPLLLASQIPQAHVRGLRLHHRDNTDTQQKDSQ